MILLSAFLIYLSSCVNLLPKLKSFVLFIGNTSYGIYLFHPILYAFLIRNSSTFESGKKDFILIFSFVLILSLVLSYILHTYYELPLMKYLKKYVKV
jgi:peptidoglycan/LPS O-acetylase OafA/YrhL